MASNVDTPEVAIGFVDNWQSGKSLAECNLHMLTSEDLCDVIFQIGAEEKMVKAHRYVLASRSYVFYAMLCGPLAEKDIIRIPEVDSETFSELLRFLYTDDTDLNPDTVAGVLYLAKKYAVGGLERRCLSYLETSLSAENACVILEQAHVFDEKQLYDRALNVVLLNGDLTLSSPEVTQLCHQCLGHVVKFAELVAKPEIVFRAALSWAEAECKRQEREITATNQRELLGEIVYEIPFPGMCQTYFVTSVVPTGILTDKEEDVLLSYFVDPDLDVSPFKIRQQTTVTIYDDRACILCEIAYYNDLAVTSVTCTDNIHLRGIHVIGCERPNNHTIEVTETSTNTVLASTRVSLSGDGEDVPPVHFSRPVLLCKDTTYTVSNRVEYDCLISVVARDLKTCEDAGRRQFLFSGTEYGTIWGLIVS